MLQCKLWAIHTCQQLVSPNAKPSISRSLPLHRVLLSYGEGRGTKMRSGIRTRVSYSPHTHPVSAKHTFVAFFSIVTGLRIGSIRRYHLFSRLLGDPLFWPILAPHEILFFLQACLFSLFLSKTEHFSAPETALYQGHCLVSEASLRLLHWLIAGWHCVFSEDEGDETTAPFIILALLSLLRTC